MALVGGENRQVCAEYLPYEDFEILHAIAIQDEMHSRTTDAFEVSLADFEKASARIFFNAFIGRYGDGDARAAFQKIKLLFGQTNDNSSFSITDTQFSQLKTVSILYKLVCAEEVDEHEIEKIILDLTPSIIGQYSELISDAYDKLCVRYQSLEDGSIEQEIAGLAVARLAMLMGQEIPAFLNPLFKDMVGLFNTFSFSDIGGLYASGPYYNPNRALVYCDLARTRSAIRPPPYVYAKVLYNLGRFDDVIKICGPLVARSSECRQLVELAQKAIAFERENKYLVRTLFYKGVFIPYFGTETTLSPTGLVGDHAGVAKSKSGFEMIVEDTNITDLQWLSVRYRLNKSFLHLLDYQTREAVRIVASYGTSQGLLGSIKTRQEALAIEKEVRRLVDAAFKRIETVTGIELLPEERERFVLSMEPPGEMSGFVGGRVNLRDEQYGRYARVQLNGGHLEAIPHEVMHFVLGVVSERNGDVLIPTWFDEGLAVFIGNDTFVVDELSGREDISGLEQLGYSYSDSSNRRDPQYSSVSYLRGYQFFEMLSDLGGRERLKEFIQKVIIEHLTPEKAYELVYGNIIEDGMNFTEFESAVIKKTEDIRTRLGIVFFGNASHGVGVGLNVPKTFGLPISLCPGIENIGSLWRIGAAVFFPPLVVGNDGRAAAIRPTMRAVLNVGTDERVFFGGVRLFQFSMADWFSFGSEWWPLQTNFEKVGFDPLAIGFSTTLRFPQ
jgi:hypothetical protein